MPDNSRNTGPSTGTDVQTGAFSMLSKFESALKMGMHTGEFARVLAYKPPSVGTDGVNLPQRVDVQLLRLTSKAVTLPDGTEQVVPDAPVTAFDIPLIWFGNAQGALIPPSTGEGVIGSIVWISSNSVSREPALTTGAPSVPHFPFMHNINNGIAIGGVIAGADAPTIPAQVPGVWKFGDFAGTWALANQIAGSLLSLSTTGPTLTLDASAEVKVGANAILSLITQTFVSVMDSMITAAVAAAVGITPPNGDGGTAAFTAFQTAWNAQKSTITTVKAKGE